MHAGTRKIAVLYGTWAVFWLAVAVFGDAFGAYGEYGLAAQFYLTFSGLPLALLSWHVIPNGSPAGVLAAGAIGLLQWILVAEAGARWDAWRKAHHLTMPHLGRRWSHRNRLLLLWFAAIVSPLGAACSLAGIVFCARLNATGAWGGTHAALCASAAFLLLCLFAATSIMAIVLLVRYHYKSRRLTNQNTAW